MTFSLIVAMSRTGVIGRQGGLPWRLPRDLKQFRHLTLGKPIIMGRKTYESLGRPLPERTNIVLTRQADFPGGGLPGRPDQGTGDRDGQGDKVP